MKVAFIEQISRAFEATRITPSRDYAWFGQSAGVPLHERLYSDFYLSGGAVASRRKRTALPVPDAATFVAGLEAVNAGSGTSSPGWTELARIENTLVVNDDQLDLALWVTLDDICHDRDGSISLRLPAQLPVWSPGFWIALGDVPSPDRHERQVRFYWNLLPDGATPLVYYATRLLNQAGIPFRLKVLADPARYTRCDAGVLYLPESAAGTAAPIIQTIYEHVRPALKPIVPALTRPLAPGLATADDPDGDESFGSHRCRLLAGAIVDAAEAGLSRLPDRVAFAIERLAANGISIDRPYVRAGSSVTESITVTLSHPARSSDPVEPATPAACRSVAIEVARHLVASAFWNDDHCGWLGSTGAVDQGQPVYGTLGPDLYGGSAGIALFLADIYEATGDDTFRKTALGAIRHALAHQRDLPDAAINGLFTGLPGLAFVAGRLAVALGMPDLLDDARRLLQGIESAPSQEDDLLSGTAGALLAVLALNGIDPDERWLAQATRLGEHLLDRASRGTHGWSWRSGQRALTGLSHGASGIGAALLELGVVTRQERFVSAALAAFRWERHHFDPETGNWPDLRRVTGRVRRSALLPAGTSWCHGAPGIALARLHAASHVHDDRLIEEAQVALATTQRAVMEALENGDESFCLCHGLAGNAEILLDGYDALGDRGLRDTAIAVAAAGINRYASDPDRWPSGTYAGGTPGLMLGLAGIGRFYLRLAGASLPSALLPVMPIVKGDGSWNANGPSGPVARAAP